MVKRTGHADLPLHTGTVPRWLADRMMQLGTQIVEALLIEYGKKEVLRRLSDPLWFQSLGAVLGMDWHSSGITTSVMYALKRGINPRARELGLCVCGGRGRYSRKTPEELLFLADATGLDGDALEIGLAYALGIGGVHAGADGVGPLVDGVLVGEHDEVHIQSPLSWY